MESTSHLWMYLFALLAGCLAVAFVDERRRFTDFRRITYAKDKVWEDRYIDANNRLLAAWKEDVKIPPSELQSFIAPRDEAPLDPVYVEWLSQYDGDARAKYERVIRQKMSKHVAPLHVLREFEMKRDPVAAVVP